MNILITGAAGFLAGPLYREARRLWQACRLVRTDLAAGPGIAACDLLDAGEARALVRRARPDLVFHLAGTARPLPPAQLWTAHVTATLNLLEALRRTPGCGAARVVVSGSSAEYGQARGTATERTPADPVTDYGRSKHAQTLAALSGRHFGLGIMVARIFNVSGPGIPEHLAPGAFARQIAAIARAAGSAGTVLTGNLAAQRDYLDVRDVARALAAVARRGRTGEVYNVCSGRTVAMKELLDVLIAASRCRIKIVRDPSRWRPVDVPHLAGSHAKLTASSGWLPRVPLKKSLADTLAYHLAQGRQVPEGADVLRSPKRGLAKMD
ncbi:MAG: GDP-mannose 4,6-dehydratase [Elusimicrobia bacterium]|nr:GDP-mannose 4,6-dehydratase [Elusimicrobiota bacterium]